MGQRAEDTKERKRRIESHYNKMRERLEGWTRPIAVRLGTQGYTYPKNGMVRLRSDLTFIDSTTELYPPTDHTLFIDFSASYWDELWQKRLIMHLKDKKYSKARETLIALLKCIEESNTAVSSNIQSAEQTKRKADQLLQQLKEDFAKIIDEIEYYGTMAGECDLEHVSA
jgi:hypothetical protein